MVEFIIKHVRVGDLAETIDLFIQQVYPGDPARAHVHFSGHAEGMAETFLAWVNGRLAGYLTLRWESNNPLFRERNIPLIHHLFLQLELRGIEGQTPLVMTGLSHGLVMAAKQRPGQRVRVGNHLLPEKLPDHAKHFW